MKINANLVKIGNLINHKNKMFQVLDTSIIKPGKGMSLQKHFKRSEIWFVSGNERYPN